jgi:Leucine-rich repeat (LRR) protein
VLRQGTPAVIAYMKRMLVGVNTGHFDLSDLGLTEIPIDIVENYTSLTSLDLSKNKISTLPRTVQNLHNLVELNLDGNPIETLQPSLGTLTSIEVLLVDSYLNIQIPPKEVTEGLNAFTASLISVFPFNYY